MPCTNVIHEVLGQRDSHFTLAIDLSMSLPVRAQRHVAPLNEGLLALQHVGSKTGVTNSIVTSGMCLLNHITY